MKFRIRVQLLADMPLHFDSKQHGRAFYLGRKRYNQRTQRQAAERRRRLVELVASGKYRATTNDALAEALGVHRVTVYRDLVAIEAQTGRCLHCGQLLPAVVEGVDP